MVMSIVRQRSKRDLLGFSLFAALIVLILTITPFAILADRLMRRDRGRDDF